MVQTLIHLVSYAYNSLQIRVPENTYFDVIKELDLLNFTSLKLKPVSRHYKIDLMLMLVKQLQYT